MLKLKKKKNTKQNHEIKNQQYLQVVPNDSKSA